MYYEIFVFNTSSRLERVGKLMKGEDGLVTRAEVVSQFLALPQALFVTWRCSLQAQLQVSWQYQLSVTLCWKQAD